MVSLRSRTLPFFALTFLLTWGLQLPGVLALKGVLGVDPALLLLPAALGIFGPCMAATWLTFREGGRAGVKALYAPLLAYRVRRKWWGAALMVPVLLAGFLALLNLAGRKGPIVYLPMGGAWVMGVVVSVAEEVGWRGYALPRLQARYGAFAASAGLGVIWYLWHLPMFVAQGVSLDLVLPMLLLFVGGSLFIGWIYRGTGGSLLLVSLAHFGAHLNNSHRALPEDLVPLIAHGILFAALGLWVMRGAVAAGAMGRAPLTALRRL